MRAHVLIPLSWALLWRTLSLPLGAACFGWSESFWALAPALPFHLASLVAKLHFKNATGYMVLHGVWHVLGAASVYRCIVATRLVAGFTEGLLPVSPQ